MQTGSKTERVIIYQAGENDGYGNRLPGLVTAFIWALLDDRVLLVEWRDDKVMMPEPAPFHELFSPRIGQFDVDEVEHMERYLKTAPVLNGRTIWEQMSEDDLGEAFPQRVIKFHSDDWLFPLLQGNPHYAARVRQLFPQGRAFAHVAKYLMPLGPKLQAKFDAFTREHLQGNIIGLHLRLQKVMPDDKGVKRFRAPGPSTFFDAARMLQLGRGMADNATVFYVATETASAVAAAREWFGERGLRVVFLDDMFPMKRKDHRDAERGSAEALHNAIVEMRLLAEADEMVGTFASSYSYSASAWGNIIPYYIMPDRSYWYAGVSEPCFRFASRGHAERATHSPEMLYHMSCAVTGHSSDVAIAERGKDGRLKDTPAAAKPKPNANRP